jgi:hypothetical protein
VEDKHPVDMLGRKIEVDDEVVWPQRKGSSMWMLHGRVEMIENVVPDRETSWRDPYTRATITVLNTSNSWLDQNIARIEVFDRVFITRKWNDDANRD